MSQCDVGWGGLTSAVADVAVIGAGLAGLASAVSLARQGFSVVVFDDGSLPRHRVCGEYVSLEVLPFLQELGLDVFALGAKRLTRLELSTLRGGTFRTQLDLGGFGLSRYRLDAELLECARAAGAEIALRTPVKQVQLEGGVHHVRAAGRSQVARLVLGCFGKRSGLDRALARPHVSRRTPYVAVKRHYRGWFPQDLVGLHIVPGGYCGISAVEGDLVNVCCLIDAGTLKARGGLRAFEQRCLGENPALSGYLKELTPEPSPPLVISQVDFENKGAVHENVLMLGDAAGLIHPLAGNGMAMAMRAAAMLAPLATRFLRGNLTRTRLEASHAQFFRNSFRTRLRVSRLLHGLFESSALSNALCATANRLPSLARLVIGSTHGSAF